MGKPEIPVEKLNGSSFFFWEAIKHDQTNNEKKSGMLRGTSSMEKLKLQDGTFVDYFLLNIPSLIKNVQWRIQGGGPSPLIFRPNWGPMGRKMFLETAPLSKCLDDRSHNPPSPLSQCPDPALIWTSLFR